MNYPFMMYGRVIWIHRYSVTYQKETLWPWNLNEKSEPFTEYCHTLEQAEAMAAQTGGMAIALDSSAYEWLDGIEVADVPDTYAEAVRIYEMGREAYEAELAKPTPEETIAALENQVTDLQLALCDFYESVVV